MSPSGYRFIAVALLGVTVACSGGGSSSSPTAPSPTPSTPTPTVTTYAVTGQVTIGNTSSPVPNATVQINDGPNAGKSATTDGGGRYTIAGLIFAGMSGTASAPGYTTQSKGISLSSGSATSTVNWQILPSAIWSKTGTGDTVFDMPTYVSRVQVIGDYGAYTSNFIVYVGGRLLVNELVGTAWNQTHFQGTYLTTGGVVEIKSSSGVRWSFLEVR